MSKLSTLQLPFQSLKWGNDRAVMKIAVHGLYNEKVKQELMAMWLSSICSWFRKHRCITIWFVCFKTSAQAWDRILSVSGFAWKCKTDCWQAGDSAHQWQDQGRWMLVMDNNCYLNKQLKYIREPQTCAWQQSQVLELHSRTDWFKYNFCLVNWTVETVAAHWVIFLFSLPLYLSVH